MTGLLPVTKFMAHLPLAMREEQPESALLICLGMGTTFRSLLTWDIRTTAVELLPSVADAFRYYHDDAEAILRSPKARIVIDDGRRFLARSRESFDVITVDPPPPAEAAGSSLLYSEQFYDLVKLRLKPDGILHQWFAFGEPATRQAVARSVFNSFPYTRVFGSVENWGYHFLASMSPIEVSNPGELAQRLPEAARRDLLEWAPNEEVVTYLNRVLSKEVPIDHLLSQDLSIRITDDRTFNEYFLLRRIRAISAVPSPEKVRDLGIH